MSQTGGGSEGQPALFLQGLVAGMVAMADAWVVVGVCVLCLLLLQYWGGQHEPGAGLTAGCADCMSAGSVGIACGVHSL